MTTSELPELGTEGIPAFLLERSLYSPVSFKLSIDAFRTLKLCRYEFDAHCVQCANQSYFKGIPVPANGQTDELLARNGRLHCDAVCVRNSNHQYDFWCVVKDRTVTKVGQNPSLEDIIGSDLRRYRSVFQDEDYAELRRATGLFSHGIGIGSFVYLRRIFERMVWRHFTGEEAARAAFARMRMDEKIGALANCLPAAIVKHKSLYAILSKGVHELSEYDCRTYFPAVHKAIIQILESDLEAKVQREAEADLEAELARISSALKSS